MQDEVNGSDTILEHTTENTHKTHTQTQIRIYMPFRLGLAACLNGFIDTATVEITTSYCFTLYQIPCRHTTVNQPSYNRGLPVCDKYRTSEW